jgi:cytochrome b subunit of formate dehydrogenase
MNRKMNFRKCDWLAIIIFLLIIIPFSADAAKNEDCFGCHYDVDQEKFESSIHGNNLCTSCHSDVKNVPHSKKPGKVQCGDCHQIEQQIYLNSDHGKAVAKGSTDAASCKSCHGDNHYLLNYRNPESQVSREKINDTCAKCHDDTKRMEPYGLTQAKPGKSYVMSVHGQAFEEGMVSAAICIDCHGSHNLHSPNNPESKIYKFNVPATCGKCHENVFNTYNMSVHAKYLQRGVKDAPVCTDCHGEHSIKSAKDPDSSVAAKSIVMTCSSCHASEKLTTKYNLPVDVKNTYMESYHGIAFQFGSKVTANCASCHGFHTVLPSDDPRSSIHPDNVGRMCGKCHIGAGKQLAKGSVHIRPSQKSDRVIFYVSLFYIIMIICVIGGMLFHNFLDLGKKMHFHYRKALEEGVMLRMTRNERWQHVILLLCFIILVYTGFAYKYPNAFYSYPFNAVEWGATFRSLLHRIAGVMFIIFMGYHGGWLVATKRGREKLVALMPRWQDAKDAINLIRYNLGMAPERPRFDHYNYIEKAEYWALIWGSFIMIITGLVMMFRDLSLQYFPKWLIDVMLVVHFYEAVLASLAILVWHFYWVMFDPHVYPMNWSWRTGKLTEHQLTERKEGIHKK